MSWHEDCYAATDSLGFCAFTTTLLYSFTPVEMAELFKYGTGIAMDEAKLMKAGERIITLEQCYNIKMGKTRAWHTLPWRLMNEPPAVDAGSTNTQQELDGMLDAFRASEIPWIVVSNEVGLGLVPSYHLGRIFRDLQGWANQRLAAGADRIYLMVAGHPLDLKALSPGI